MSFGLDKQVKALAKSQLSQIPMSYLWEGDRFVAIRPGDGLVVTGYAHMDGHSVSKLYGLRAGNPVDPATDYINVRLDRVDYSSRSEFWPNTGLYASDDWKFYVSHGIALRYANDLRRNEQLEKERAKELRKDKQKAKILELRNQAILLEKKVEHLKDKIQRLTEEEK